jgi:hypothetical protein
MSMNLASSNKGRYLLPQIMVYFWLGAHPRAVPCSGMCRLDTVRKSHRGRALPNSRSYGVLAMTITLMRSSNSPEAALGALGGSTIGDLFRQLGFVTYAECAGLNRGGLLRLSTA